MFRSLQSLRSVFYNSNTIFSIENLANSKCCVFHTVSHLRNVRKDSELLSRSVFEQTDKDKEAFLKLVEKYKNRLKKTGHVEFIRVALKHMREFGVHRDIEVYKKLIDVLPSGRFVPKNYFQSEFYHYPRHQDVILELLHEMELNGVIPDWSMEDQLISKFGSRGYPLRRYWRMMYWMPKFKNTSPWPVPKPPPTNPLELASLAISRISSADLETEVSIFKTNELDDYIDDTWIVSAQSPFQKFLIENHPRSLPIYIEGPYTVWLRDTSIKYFVFRSDVNPNRRRRQWGDIDDVSNLHSCLFSPPTKNDMTPWLTVHEQQDGNIYAVVATGTSSENSLSSWIEFLMRNGNSRLNEIPILFRINDGSKRVEPEKVLIESEVKAT